MTAHGRSGERFDPWGSFEPYVQLIRSLLPRATSVAVFDAQGETRWSSETTTGPDLAQIIEEVLPLARHDEDGAGEMRLIGGTQPVYVCWLRDDDGALLAIVAVVCRPTSPRIRKAAPSHVHTRSCGPRWNACGAT